MKRILFAIPTALMLATPALAQSEPQGLVAQIAGPDGADMGSVAAAPTPSGTLLLTIFLKGLEPGIRAIHIHETGACEGPDFTSAGGHLANGHDHGVMADGGPHPGDLPNIHVPDSGEVRLELFAPGLTTDMLTDADGAAFVIHAQADDYTGQPTGNAGDRIGCGVFAPAQN
ncbi:MAG: superoxide dismutase family protein [Paracoccus sp. (in: a-proteobacteria)]|uniref:superoxide dismutase family protein n=1 Tax=Paracoccus sp. TaxID=267 RepID=UPI0026DF81D9|nr:superoxide dismutase family protein [Paracoccus sp. (in: a-proteobacteria)]MDO5632287.1 superoxide dismutase family protein [Paracoccus sp. (in: a-proteobacteria)]